MVKLFPINCRVLYILCGAGLQPSADSSNYIDRRFFCEVIDHFLSNLSATLVDGFGRFVLQGFVGVKLAGILKNK